MARLTMLRMHRDGIITLPPPRHGLRPRRVPEFGPETDPPATPMPETLDAVRPIRLVKVTGADRAASVAWNGFIARWHYLGYTPLIGAQMRYAVQDREGRPLAMLGFSAAAWKTAPRDAFIGWSAEVRERNLYRVINNSRYLIMPWIHIPNLASHILSSVRRQLPEDWQRRYNISPVLMETFVETPRFSGVGGYGKARNSGDSPRFGGIELFPYCRNPIAALIGLCITCPVAAAPCRSLCPCPGDVSLALRRSEAMSWMRRSRELAVGLSTASDA